MIRRREGRNSGWRARDARENKVSDARSRAYQRINRMADIRLQLLRLLFLPRDLQRSREGIWISFLGFKLEKPPLAQPLAIHHTLMDWWTDMATSAVYFYFRPWFSPRLSVKILWHAQRCIFTASNVLFLRRFCIMDRPFNLDSVLKWPIEQFQDLICCRFDDYS